MVQRAWAISTPQRREAFLAHLRSVGPGDPCIIWPWAHTPGKYVRVSIKGRIHYAHRWVWQQIKGPVPDGLEVCHNCAGGDNPSCVRPSHLWLGTHSENIRDSYAKGRMHGNNRNHPAGEEHWAARLSAEDVYAIRRRIRNREISQRALAFEYGLTAAAINAIVKRRTWSTLPDEIEDPTT